MYNLVCSPSYPDYDPEADSDDDDLSLVEVKPGEDAGDETELILPSGARIGHRSLMRYDWLYF